MRDAGFVDAQRQVLIGAAGHADLRLFADKKILRPEYTVVDDSKGPLPVCSGFVIPGFFFDKAGAFRSEGVLMVSL
jgi:hypothetical protein